MLSTVKEWLWRYFEMAFWAIIVLTAAGIFVQWIMGIDDERTSRWSAMRARSPLGLCEVQHRGPGPFLRSRLKCVLGSPQL